jgi:hypothetical protein
MSNPYEPPQANPPALPSRARRNFVSFHGLLYLLFVSAFLTALAIMLVALVAFVAHRLGGT